MNKEALIQLAYTFFPKGISDLDREQYENTNEFKHLLRVLEDANALNEPWNQLLQTLNKEGLELEEIGFPEKPPRVFRIAARKKGNKSQRIVINISRLIPFYSLYVVPVIFDAWAVFYGATFDKFHEDDIPVIKKIEEAISFHFKGYEIFPPDLVKVEIGDVQYGDLGILDQDPHKDGLNPMRLFNVYFSSFIFF